MNKPLSDQQRCPSHSWGVFAQDTSLDVGASGEVWAEAVHNAWLKSGGTDETFAELFPQFSDYMRTQPVPAWHR
ncbi:MAG TPA: hypothetical protein VGO49_09175 [Bradyrhizobium sp.]|jgi:hypothetical protein|nr:hypothetical protein [Bradyrhizobium sp.]